jgi:hypothetical protein
VLGSARSVLMKAPTGSNPLPGGAMALYNFNENTGTTAADSSGNSRTITFGTGGAWAASGHTGSAMTNTSTSIGGKAVFTAPAVAITIMAWVKPLDLTAGSSHFAFGFVDNGDSTGCAIFTQRGDGFGAANVLQGDIRIGGSLLALNGSALTVGTWVHLAITYDGATAILYKDGASVTSVSSVGNIGQGDALCVAGGMFDASYDSDVVVDDVRVYSSALTAGQIVTGMNTPVV